MTRDVAIQVDGLPEMLRTLKRLDPELRKQIPKRFKTAAQFLVDDARALVPNTPASGWGKGGRLGFKPGVAKRSIRLKFRGTRGRRKDTFSLLTLTTGKNAALSVLDIAGRKSSGTTRQGQALIRKLNQTRRASRVVWESAERNADAIEQVVRKLTNDVAADIDRLARRR